jgi:long-chain acyl-CoA synthetase
VGELLAWAAGRLGRDKLPREVAYLPSLPLGPSGKVLKRELVARLVDGRIATQRRDTTPGSD